MFPLFGIILVSSLHNQCWVRSFFLPYQSPFEAIWIYMNSFKYLSDAISPIYFFLIGGFSNFINPLPPTIHKRSSYHSPIKYIDLLCLLWQISLLLVSFWLALPFLWVSGINEAYKGLLNGDILEGVIIFYCLFNFSFASSSNSFAPLLVLWDCLTSSAIFCWVSDDKIGPIECSFHSLLCGVQCVDSHKTKNNI